MTTAPWNVAHELAFGLQRGLGPMDEAQAVGHAKDVGVDRDRRDAKRVARTTLAVFRPTPGSFSRASRSAGTWPSCS